MPILSPPQFIHDGDNNPKGQALRGDHYQHWRCSKPSPRMLMPRIEPLPRISRTAETKTRARVSQAHPKTIIAEARLDSATNASLSQDDAVDDYQGMKRPTPRAIRANPSMTISAMVTTRLLLQRMRNADRRWNNLRNNEITMLEHIIPQDDRDTHAGPFMTEVVTARRAHSQ